MRNVMKKVLVLATAAAMAMTTAAFAESTTEAVEEKSEGVMTYAEYAEAAVDDEVTIEAYVQAKQGWWENEGVGTATIYTQDQDGAYFVYNMPIEQEDYDKLVEGQKIKVTGFKSEWAGEVEIMDVESVEIEDGNWVAPVTDVTEFLGTDELADFMNQKVSFKGMTVEAISVEASTEEATEAAAVEDAAFLYNWDGSGAQGDDLYFNVSKDGQTYQFTVESYLCGADTEVYQAVENLKVGDVIDLEGFLYWYEGANPHITAVAPAAAEEATSEAVTE